MDKNNCGKPQFLGDCCLLEFGFAFDSSKFNSDGIGVPLVRIRDIKRGSTATYTTELFDDRYIVKDGDLLIGMDGEFNLIKWSGGNAVLNQRVCRIRSNDPGLLDDYLRLFLSKELKKIEAVTSKVTVKHLSAKKLKQIEIAPPAPSEQKRMVSEIEAVDAMVRCSKDVISRLDSLVKSRFNEMFGDYESWLRSSDKKRLDELCWIGSSKRVHKNDYVSDGIPFFRSKEIVELSKGERPTTELYIERDRFERITEKNGAPAAGDLLVTAVGTIGVIWIVDGCSPFYFKDGNLLWLKPNNMEPTFLKYLLSELLSKNVDRLTGGSAYKALTIDRISQMMVVVPSPALQSEFAFFAHQVDKLRFDVQQQIDKLELLKSSLMQEYFG